MPHSFIQEWKHLPNQSLGWLPAEKREKYKKDNGPRGCSSNAMFCFWLQTLVFWWIWQKLYLYLLKLYLGFSIKRNWKV